jgi:CrcB protein
VVAAVFAGGCLGGLARYAIARAWPSAAGGFPWAVFVVNDAGAFALALLLVVAAGLLPPSTYLRPFLGTGLCGAFTTFSAVAVSADRLGGHRHSGTAATYVVASVIGGLAAAAAGLIVGGLLVDRHRPDPESGSA